MSKEAAVAVQKQGQELAVPRLSIFGVPVAKINMQDTVTLLTNKIRQKKSCQVITANPIMVMEALKNSTYHDMMSRAELIVADGTGLVWAAERMGEPLPERVPGIELMEELFKVGEREGFKVYFVGASQEVIDAAVANIQKKYPKLQVAGYRDGFFDRGQDQQVIEQIRQAEPDMLFVGRSAATQDPWIDEYKQQLQVPVMMGVGGSFDIWSGKSKRAPGWMIKLRLEWFYRLVKEPWRFKRMLVIPQFMWKVIRFKGRM